MPLRLLRAPLGDESPDKENDNGADDGADEPGTLAGRIPPKRLPEEARNECAHDAQDRRQYETLGLVAAARHDELSDHARDKPNDDRPDDTHGLSYDGLGDDRAGTGRYTPTVVAGKYH